MVKKRDIARSEARSDARPMAAKKSYKAPKLTEYGSVARLTAGVNGSHHDPGHNTNAKVGGG
jgi:hypothetical protein